MIWIIGLLSMHPLMLGSDSFAVRERASKSLEACWPLSAPLCYNGLRSSDPEIRRRCRDVIDHNPPTWAYHVAAWCLLLHADPPESIDPRLLLPFIQACRTLGLLDGTDEEWLEQDQGYMLQRIWCAFGRLQWSGGD